MLFFKRQNKEFYIQIFIGVIPWLYAFFINDLEHFIMLILFNLCFWIFFLKEIFYPPFISGREIESQMANFMVAILSINSFLMALCFFIFRNYNYT